LKYHGGVTQEILNTLPKTLLDLRLEALNDRAPLDGRGFHALGRLLDLQKLHLTFKLTDAEDWMLSLLPRKLFHLTLSGACPHLTGSCFEHLPPDLEMLNLTRLTSARDTDLAKLPRKLRRVCFEELQGLTPAGVVFLPTTIQSYYFGNTRLNQRYYSWIAQFGKDEFPDSRVCSPQLFQNPELWKSQSIKRYAFLIDLMLWRTKFLAIHSNLQQGPLLTCSLHGFDWMKLKEKKSIHHWPCGHDGSGIGSVVLFRHLRPAPWRSVHAEHASVWNSCCHHHFRFFDLLSHPLTGL